MRTKVTQEKRVFTRSDRDAAFRELEDLAYLDRHRLHEVGESLLIWRMPGFYLRREDVGRRLSRAAKFPNMILDLRGNPGGAIETLEYMLGGFIGDKVPIGEVKSREKIPPIVSRKPPGRYEGTLVVLVDSESGSSAEIFARAMQINGRAKVLGDRTAGSVMMSLFHPQKIGMGMTLYFGSSITVADIVMTDGKSLERLGVTPDEVLIPTGEDLAAGRDPVLSRAASLCGVSLSPSEAGALFPLEWKR